MTVHSHSWLLCTLVLGASGLTLLGGCGPSVADEAETGLVTQESEIKIANSLSTQTLVFNGISTNALANTLVRTSALGPLFNTSPENGHPHIRHQLLDPNARKFMEYLVGCALAPGQTLHWQDANWPGDNGASGDWVGGVGICPHWLSEPPTAACLSEVSACILARNNAVDRRVELSLRGMYSDGSAFPLEAQPSLVKYDPEVSATAQPIESFESCPAFQEGPRDCGWVAGNIGSCTPNTWVRLGAGGQALNASGACTAPVLGSTLGSQSMIRVCNGIVGCNSQQAMAQSATSCNTSQKPAVSFLCPSSGFFNVMTAPWVSWQRSQPTVAVESTWQNHAVYPATEKSVFHIREGAFFGNLFTAGVLAEVTVRSDGSQAIWPPVVTGSVYPKIYACSAPGWFQPAAYATHRLCALPEQQANCAATIVGTCECSTFDAPPFIGDGDYDNCRAPEGDVWAEPVTVYLNSPCDLMPAGQPGLCAFTAP